MNKPLKILAIIFFGLIALNMGLTYIFISNDEEKTPYQSQESIRAQQEEAESRARVKARLTEELKNNRPYVIREIKELIAKKEYMAAYSRADRFRDLDEPEIKDLAQKALSQHEEVLQTAKKEEEKRIASALTKMIKKTDKIEGIDWYRDKSSPSYNNQNGFFLYIGKRGNESPWMRLRIQYYSDDWLFINSFIVVADGKRFERNQVKFDRDHGSSIWEWYDENLTESDLQMIRAIIESKEAVIRFHGQKYKNDKIITASQKASLQRVLDAYKALGGK
jgi:hypothetical protein